MDYRPVLYLDLDDTILSWADGKPAGAAGVREFLLWALDTFEIRWLTRWARGGCMEPRLVHDLAKMTGVPAPALAGITGLDWEESDSKLDGVAWLEHTVLGRPFLWIEDDSLPAAHVAFLADQGFADSYLHCNVTRDPDALVRLHERLERSVFW